MANVRLNGLELVVYLGFTLNIFYKYKRNINWSLIQIQSSQV